jgi:hypothetical protein
MSKQEKSGLPVPRMVSFVVVEVVIMVMADGKGPISRPNCYNVTTRWQSARSKKRKKRKK